MPKPQTAYMKRRKFLANTALAIAGAHISMGWKSATSTSGGMPPAKKIALEKNDIILFTGDSITDGARERTVKAANIPRALGSGYAAHTAARIYSSRPHLNLRIYNRGINGNSIKSLLGRWTDDCLKLKPTIVSILIGVNDFNASFTATGKGDPERFRSEYQELIRLTKNGLPGVRLVIGEPYAVKGAREKIDKWFPGFTEYQQVAREIASQEGACFIPYQHLYDTASGKAPKLFYSRDGVHPSLAGVQLMSDGWCSILKK